MSEIIFWLDAIGPRVQVELDGKNFDPNHSYLRQRGFTDETIDHFGIGFCNYGMLQGSIVIPLHNTKGELVGYAGTPTDQPTSEENAMHRLRSAGADYQKMSHGREPMLLYNAHRLSEYCTRIVFVESFESVWWLYQNGAYDTVAPIGSTCHVEDVLAILHKLPVAGRIWIISQGNAAGHRWGWRLVRLLSPHRFVRWIQLEQDEQATDLTAEEITAILST